MIRNFYDTFKSLLPNGRAFRIPDGTQFRELSESLGEEPDRIRDYFDDTRDSGIPGRIPADCLGEWETMLNLRFDSTLTDNERQARIIARMFSVGGQGLDYLESALNQAGFPVKIYDPVLATTLQTGYVIPCAPTYESDGTEKTIVIPDYCFSIFDHDDVPTINQCLDIATNERGNRVIMIDGNAFKLYISDDCGETWTETQPAGNVQKQWNVVAMSADGETIFAGIANGRLYKTINGGTNWAETQPAGDTDKYWNALGMSSDGQTVYAGVGVITGRLYKTINCGTNWAETQPAGAADRSWNVITVSADGQTVYVGVGWANGRLYKTINGGTNWAETQPAGAADKDWRVLSMSADCQTVLAGVYAGRLYKTINGGTNWAETQPAGVADKQWTSGAVSPDGKIAYVFELAGLGLYKSIDSIATWESYNPVLGTERYSKIKISLSGAISYFGDSSGIDSKKEFFYFKKIIVIADPTGQDVFVNIATNLQYDFFDLIYRLKPLDAWVLAKVNFV